MKHIPEELVDAVTPWLEVALASIFLAVGIVFCLGRAIYEEYLA